MDIKEQILEGALHVFNENGLKFTMDQLAKQLGMSKKTLYTVFSDKESLFVEMVNACFDAIKASERRVLEDPSLSVVEKIEQIIIVLPERYQTIDFRELYELETKYPKIYARVAGRIETDWEPTLALLQQGMDEGLIKPIQLTVFQTMISATIEAFIRSDHLKKEGITYVEALTEMIRIAMYGIVK